MANTHQNQFHDDKHIAYDASIQQKNEILGIGVALQVIADNGKDSYDEDYLDQIVAQMDALTRALDFRTTDCRYVLKNFTLDTHGRYYYYHAESLVDHIPDITVAYGRLTNLALQK